MRYRFILTYWAVGWIMGGIYLVVRGDMIGLDIIAIALMILSLRIGLLIGEIYNEINPVKDPR